MGGSYITANFQGKMLPVVVMGTSLTMLTMIRALIFGTGL